MPATPFVTFSRAEQHEALWLRLTALHNDLGALAARRSTLPVSAAVRVAAEALLSDCAPFGDGDRLPQAAVDAAGLLVQLGQALARLDASEATHTFWESQAQLPLLASAGGRVPGAAAAPATAAAPHHL